MQNQKPNKKKKKSELMDTPVEMADLLVTFFSICSFFERVYPTTRKLLFGG